MDASLGLALRRLVHVAQAEGRAPSVLALLARDGETLFSHAVGVADTAAAEPPTPDTQFRIGSITKTFTTAALLSLRDAGALGLDDPLGEHLPETGHERLRLRDLLAHVSGLQREPAGDVWDTMAMPGREELLRSLPGSEAVLAPQTAFHYSNLAFAVLGEVVARRAGAAYEQVVEQRLLEPLGLHRTTWTAAPPAARGFLVQPYLDVAEPEPDVDLGGGRAGGQLWSNAEDLARWGACLAGARPDVLSARAVEDMHTLQVMYDPHRWTIGWGLGLALYRHGERIYAGHGGAMPGFRAGLIVAREPRLAAVVLANATAGVNAERVAVRLLSTLLDAEPLLPEPFTAAPPPPAELAELAGRWWSEGVEFVLRVHAGQLRARVAQAPADEPWAVFEPDGPDRFRGVSGRERGELLRVERDAGGRAQRLFWASYPFERNGPRPFGPAAG